MGRARVNAWYVVFYTCLLHCVWAVLLVASPAAEHSTPVSIIVTASGGRWAAVTALILCAAAAWLPPLLPRHRGLLALLVPQQLLLLLSAGAGIYAAAAGHYADGVPRPWPFILGDQLPVIFVAFLYSAALLAIGRGEQE